MYPSRNDSVVQVKYTNQTCRFTNQEAVGMNVQALIGISLAFPGSNQARKGRLVDALAVRGDEGRDTLR